jgi:hypothetical protein
MSILQGKQYLLAIFFVKSSGSQLFCMIRVFPNTTCFKSILDDIINLTCILNEQVSENLKCFHRTHNITGLSPAHQPSMTVWIGYFKALALPPVIY